MTKEFEEWKNNSIIQHEDKFVIDKLLNDPDSICVCLICRHCHMSEKLIEQVYYITAGLYKKNEILYKESQLNSLVKFKWLYSNDTEAKAAVECIIYNKTHKVQSEEILPKNGMEVYNEVLGIPTVILQKYRDILGGKDTTEKVDWKAIKECQNVSKAFKNRYYNKFLSGPKGFNENFIPKGKYQSNYIS